MSAPLRDDQDRDHGDADDHDDLDAVGERLQNALEREREADAEQLEAVLDVARALFDGKRLCGRNTQAWSNWLEKHGWDKTTRRAHTYVTIAEHEPEYRQAWAASEKPTIDGVLLEVLNPIADAVDPSDRKPASGRGKRKVLEPPELSPVAAALYPAFVGLVGQDKAKATAGVMTETIATAVSNDLREARLDAWSAAAPEVEREVLERILDADRDFLLDV